MKQLALRLICAAFKTTPTTALEIEASIPPIKLQIESHLRRCAIRFNKLSSTNPIIQRLPDEWRNNQKPTCPPPLPQRPRNSNSKANKAKTTTLLNIARFTSPAHERLNPYLLPPWRRTAEGYKGRLKIIPHTNGIDKETATIQIKKHIASLRHTPTSLLVFTDGSTIKKAGFQRTGAATIGYHENEEVFTIQMGLGGHAEEYDGEMAALMMAATQAVEYSNNHNEIQHIHFFSDSTAAVSSIFDPKPQSGQHYSHTFHVKIRAFLDTNPDATVTINWCPAHQNIAGNEKADERAREATNLARTSPVGVTWSNAMRRARNAPLKLWLREWDKRPMEGRYAISNRIRPSLKTTLRFRKLDDEREIFGRMVQCRSGHAYTGEFRQQFAPGEPTACPCNNDTLETREHIIIHCQRYERHRDILREAYQELSLPEIFGTPNGIDALCEFLRQSGAFSRTGAVLKMQPQPLPENEPIPPIEDSDDETPNDEG